MPGLNSSFELLSIRFDGLKSSCLTTPKNILMRNRALGAEGYSTRIALDRWVGEFLGTIRAIVDSHNSVC